MDSFQAAVTSLAVIAVVLLMVVFVCHYLGPRATAWVRSNREEKIGLSKSKLFNANGYMIHSGSDFLLSSSGSFKRFDSIDRDYKQVGQSSLIAPAWNIPQTDIPPQPLRPAPAPVPTHITTKVKEISEKPLKQKSLEAESISTVIPRPVARRQMSTPTKKIGTCIDSEINLSNAVEKMRNQTRIKTNPFLNGSLAPLANCSDNPPINRDRTTQETPQDEEHYEVNVYNFHHKNPFTADCIRVSQRDANQISSSREPPKTDVDRRNIFDFEPEKIVRSVDSQVPQQRNIPIQPIAEGKYAWGPPERSNSIELRNSERQNIEGRRASEEQRNVDGRRNSEANSNTEEKSSFETRRNSDERHRLENRKNSIERRKSEQLLTSQREETPLATDNKFADSPRADAFENIEKMLKNHYRNRSFSETEATESDLQMIAKNPDFFKSSNTNPFLDKNTMHKTFSENYLARNNNYQTWSFGRSLSRQESSTSLGRYNSSQSSLDGDRGSLDSVNLQRAISCDSVSSESSVVLEDLEQPTPPITGYLCVGLQYDKNSITEDGVELVVTVMEAKELIGPPGVESFDTFVRIYLVPDETGAMQTKLFKNSSCPSYNETICFWLSKKRTRRSLWFHLYHSGNAHTLIGEAEMQICDVSRPVTTWLPLSDSRQNNANWGELMFSLSYLPTAERLTVVVVKARNLKLDQDGREAIDFSNIFVKVYLLKSDKKVSKKKTSLKRSDRCPIFNESMIFSIPPYILNSVQVRLTVMSVCETEMIPIGHVIVGGNTSGKGVRHWHQMLSSLRKPVAMWHALRRTSTVKGKYNVT